MTGNDGRKKGRSNGTVASGRPKSMGAEAFSSALGEQGLDQTRPQSRAVIENRNPVQHTTEAEDHHDCEHGQRRMTDDEYFSSPGFQDFLANHHDQNVAQYAVWQNRQFAAYERIRQQSLESKDNGRLTRELEKLREEHKKLQMEAMSTVDRFQAISDSDVQRDFSPVINGVASVAQRLNQMKSSLSEDEWQSAAGEMMYLHSFNLLKGEPWAEKEIRRMVLKNVMWGFLMTEIFNKVFGGFAGETAIHLQNSYHNLYPDPHADKDSVRWRSMTASRLECLQDHVEVEQLKQSLQSKFTQDILGRLGYDISDAKANKKARETIAAGLVFSRLVASQRAIFRLEFLDVQSGTVEKYENDEIFTLIDDEDEDTAAGLIWFVSRPRLVKWGNGVGDKLDTSITVAKANVRLVNQ